MLNGTHSLHAYKELLHNVRVLKSRGKAIISRRLRGKGNSLTLSIAPGADISLRAHSNKMVRALATIASAAGDGPGLTVGTSFINTGGGGLSWAIKIAASDSHVAVSWRRDARHTSSRSGPAWRLISVVSLGRQVMDLNRSLKACSQKGGSISK